MKTEIKNVRIVFDVETDKSISEESIEILPGETIPEFIKRGSDELQRLITVYSVTDKM